VVSNLTEVQNLLLTRMEVYCHEQQTTAWVGSGSELAQIGGSREMLYELERLGYVTLNRIGEKWIVVPDRATGMSRAEVMERIQESERKRHLFYSLAGLLGQLKRGHLVVADLDEGLFALQTGREVALSPDRNTPSVQTILGSYAQEDQEAIRMLWVQVVQPAVEIAEQEGRVIWREEGERHLSYTRLAGFLLGHGISVPGQMTREGVLPPDWSSGNVQRFLAEHAPDLVVVV
jgi:hypothetical protein